MKKKLSYYLVVLLLKNPLISAADIQSSKADPKQLEKRHILFKKSFQEYDNALEKYQACAINACKQEKRAINFAEHWQTQEAYRMQKCLQRRCPKEYERLEKAQLNLRSHIIGLATMIYIGFLGGTALVAAAIYAGTQLAKKRTKITNLMQKYELDGPRDREILEKFQQAKHTTESLATCVERSLTKGIEISGALRDALADLYYDSQPTNYQMDVFNDQLRAYDVIVLEPSL